MVYIHVRLGNLSPVPLIFLVSFKVDMLFLIWTKFQENLSIGSVLIYLT